MEANILVNGSYIIMFLIFYNLINQNMYYLKYIINIIINITPIYFLILINLLFILYIILKARIRINFSISFN